ncbi:MAG: glycosyltransferase family 1 protein [Bacteroidota bacterium]|nr:glycosyltransferase family 1 protein [Bacteroidota bacterium]
MKIAVNTRLLVKDRLEGIGWFTYENLKRITQQHPEHQFYFIFDRKFSRDFIFAENIKPLVSGPQARHPILYYLWFKYTIPRLLKKIRPDVFLSPDGYLPLSVKNIPMVDVFHDLNFEHYPEDLPWAERTYYRYFFPRYARHATRIATVSEFSKKDIIRQYRIPAGKIDVVYNGANEKFSPVSRAMAQYTRRQYADGKPYFFFIGALHPRKNLVNLFAAFDEFRKNTDNDIKMVVAGERKWWTPGIREAFERMHYKDEVFFPGRLGADELHRVLASALALTYVSYFEGFGIPIVEAFRCHVPVITSNVTSMPEVAGEAALLVDPFEVSSIADAMRQIASSDELRKDLAEKGSKRMQEFTWQKSSERLWKTIEKATKTQIS